MIMNVCLCICDWPMQCVIWQMAWHCVTFCQTFLCFFAAPERSCSLSLIKMWICFSFANPTIWHKTACLSLSKSPFYNLFCLSMSISLSLTHTNSRCGFVSWVLILCVDNPLPTGVKFLYTNLGERASKEKSKQVCFPTSDQSTRVCVYARVCLSSHLHRCHQ